MGYWGMTSIFEGLEEFGFTRELMQLDWDKWRADLRRKRDVSFKHTLRFLYRSVRTWKVIGLRFTLPYEEVWTNKLRNWSHV
jgi:hypothetical protein